MKNILLHFPIVIILSLSAGIAFCQSDTYLDSTKIFTIDSITGKVEGASFLKLTKIIDRKAGTAEFNAFNSKKENLSSKG